MPNEELKPCPFCDKTNLEIVGAVNQWVQCQNHKCQCEGPVGKSSAKAVAAWNTRPGDAVIEAAQKVADAWHKRPHGLTVTNAIADSMDALAVLMPLQDAEEKA